MDRITDYAEEILQMETDFASMAADSGLMHAFLQYAADDAVIMRSNKIYKGKSAIQAYFEAQTLKNIQLQWKPDHIDVSESGDMAFTYGNFTFSATTPEGEEVRSEGIFHTVWKRQADGNWKFVYD
ncbi:MAG: nuclear transport factor 2 family protein [Bacteroidetes bacterium]|nr:nuclear transport factor 2 family protein [Bacteroidota bacterium]